MLKVFSIRDAKGAFYNNPYFKPSMGEGERDFMTAVNDDRTMLNKYPEDFDLYYLGEFDPQSGVMISLDTPQHMMKAVDVLRPKDKKTMNGASPVPLS